MESLVPCVWLHGTGLAGVSWNEDLEDLWPVLPGHLDVPRTHAHVEAYADVIEPLLPEQFVIVGHSLGGMIALTLAARLEARCKALVLIETPLTVAWWMRAGVYVLPFVAWPRIMARFVAIGSTPDVRQKIRHAFAATPRAGLIDALRAASQFEGAAMVESLSSMPTLVLLGKRSPITRASDAVGTVRYFDAGHTLPLDASDEVIHAIREFLCSIPPEVLTRGS